MRRFTKIISLSLILITLFTISQLAVSQNVISDCYESYYDSDVSISVHTMDDLFYIPNADGVTLNPILVKALAESKSGFLTKLVPSEITIEILSIDYSSKLDSEYFGATYHPPDLFDIDDYSVGFYNYGTELHASYTVGVSGTFGDNTYRVGTTLSATWNYYSTSIQFTRYYPENSIENTYWYKLGKIYVDTKEYGGTNEVMWGILINLGVINSMVNLGGGAAYNRAHHVFYFKINIKITWAIYTFNLIFWQKSQYTVSKTYSITVGDKIPSTDAKLYLLEASNSYYNIIS